MTENIKARYIDPMVDWSFKRLFGTEVNKDILIEFLKVIFPDAGITDISYIPTEQLGMMEEDRKAVFDVLCRTEDGREFLVEMQRGMQSHFFERALFYTSFPIMKQGRKSLAEENSGVRKPWNFSLDGVFFLGVLNFGYREDDRIEHRYKLREVSTGEVMTDKLEFVFVEVAKFGKGEDELETDLDRWLYMLKNLSRLLERPAALRDRIFGRIFDVAEIASLDDADKKNYVNAMNTERDTYNQIEYAREQGERKRALAIAKNFLKMGIPCENVAEATGLELSVVEEMKAVEHISEKNMLNEMDVKMKNAEVRGQEERALEISKKLLNMGIPFEKVAEATGISVEELRKMK